MLIHARLKNFKSFDDVQLKLMPFTVLLGPNGAGKSSFLQALLAVRQSLVDGPGDRLILNGPLVTLGTGHDVLRQGADEELIQISFEESEDQQTQFTAAYDADADALPLEIVGEPPESFLKSSFTYLAAERIGPRLVSPRSLQRAALGDVGPRGEGALAVLEEYRAAILPEDDPRRAGRSGSLEELFQHYLECICPTARIELHAYREMDSIGASYTFTPPGGLPGLPVRPTNVGFGLSYTLPIIVAALVAKVGELLIVENPEAHLHTVSQRAMTELLFRTASAGVQVIVETHSRETFHWLRNKAIAGEIDGGAACIHYIQAEYINGERVSRCSTLDRADSSLDEWPQSFFDEYGSPSDLIAPVGAP